VPCATTFTVIPVFRFTIGSKYSNKPESCVDVVEATTIDWLSCATLGAAAKTTAPIATAAK
jgi:hypothetical protein